MCSFFSGCTVLAFDDAGPSDDYSNELHHAYDYGGQSAGNSGTPATATPRVGRRQLPTFSMSEVDEHNDLVDDMEEHRKFAYCKYFNSKRKPLVIDSGADRRAESRIDEQRQIRQAVTNHIHADGADADRNARRRFRRGAATAFCDVS